MPPTHIDKRGEAVGRELGQVDRQEVAAGMATVLGVGVTGQHLGGGKGSATLPPRHRLGRAFMGLGALTLGATAFGVAGSATLAHILTSPRRLRTIAARAVDDTIKAVAFRTADGLTLRGWYLAHAAPRAAISIAHGFAMNRHELLDLAHGLCARGYAVLLFDFRAHGASEGYRSTIGYREADDLVAAVAFLAETHPELSQGRIGVAGISMGAAAALLAAAREPRIAAVAADSSFAVLRDVVIGTLQPLRRLPPLLFARLVIRFGELLAQASIGGIRPIDTVGALAPRPLLVIHCAADPFIPVADAHALHARAGTPKELWIVPDGVHATTFLRESGPYLDRLDGFFTRALDAQPACGSEAADTVHGGRDHQELDTLARGSRAG